VEGRGVRTFEKDRLNRADGVDENLTLLLSPGVVAQRHGGRSITITVVCKGEVITVFVREYLPHEGYIFGLAEQQDPCLINFLYAYEEAPRGK
jgi:hypothetical protein